MWPNIIRLSSLHSLNMCNGYSYILCRVRTDHSPSTGVTNQLRFWNLCYITAHLTQLTLNLTVKIVSNLSARASAARYEPTSLHVRSSYNVHMTTQNNDTNWRVRKYNSLSSISYPCELLYTSDFWEKTYMSGKYLSPALIYATMNESHSVMTADRPTREYINLKHILFYGYRVTHIAYHTP